MIHDGQNAADLIQEPSCHYTMNLFSEPAEAIQETTSFNRANLGTFQDSLRAPVHRWFTYPAGFSFKAVEEAFRLYHIQPGMTVYDPFAGTGTTNVTAKQHGIHSFGVEAHPFVQFVAQTKLFWEYDFPNLLCQINVLIENLQQTFETADLSVISVETEFPELVCKCYRPEKLARLFLCRQAILQLPLSPFRNFAKLGLTNLLRAAADVATGWPYIAPQKAKTVTKANSNPDIAGRLRDQLYQMYGDLQAISRTKYDSGCATLIAGDSRQRQERIVVASIDLAFTSPPYLNNYDYADRTRLETYFWGEAKTWGDITEKVRTRLIMSATTQINRSDYDAAKFLGEALWKTAPDVASELNPKVQELSIRRLTKGGKKSYDILVAGYFNDMLQVINEAYRILKPGAAFVMILGDSAPYGVHIPTDIYLGEIGKAVGFKEYAIEDLRVRGGKWKDNPQRHNVVLKESILTLLKH